MMRFIREAIAIVAGIFGPVVLWQAWDRLPAQIPTHFDAAGRPDGYGSPSTLVLVPAISAFLYLVMTAFSFFPETFNYPVKVTEQNRARVQAIAVSMLGWIKAEIMCVLAYVTWSMVRVAKGEASGLGLAFLPVMFAAVGLTIAIGIVQTRRAVLSFAAFGAPADLYTEIPAALTPVRRFRFRLIVKIGDNNSQQGF